MKLKLRSNSYLLLAFLLPMVILMGVYITFYVYPFGDGSVLVLDLNGQYVSYFEAFRQAFLEGGSLFYSWNTTLGSDMLGLSAYYILSPFSFLTLLFPKEHITEALLLMTLMKLGAASATMSYYTVKHGCSKERSVLFGLAYGLCGYAVVQVMNLMWIDAVILLPLWVLGIEKLLEEDKRGLFLFSLVALFITNYYIAYMIGLFGGLYFIYYSIKMKYDRKRILRALGWFIVYTIIAILLCAWLLIPTAYSLTLGKTTFTSPDYSFRSKFDILDFFTKLLPSTYDSVDVQGLPFIYASVFGLYVCVLYFLNHSISHHQKVCSALLLVTIFFCMNLSTVDLVLHGFQNPNWLNYRYAFVWPFLMLSLGSECLVQREGLGTREYGIGTISLVVLFAMIQKFDYSYVSDMNSITVGILVLLAYMVLLMNHRKRWSLFLILMVLCAELFGNSYTSLHALDKEVLYSTRESYIPYMEETRTILSMIDYNDPGFYRIEKNYHRTVNDPLSLNMMGISHSTSTLNAKAIRLLAQMGYSSRDHWSKYLGGTLVSDSLLGIQYVLHKDDEIPYGYALDFSYEYISVYENPYALGILNGVYDSILETDMEELSPFVQLNTILSDMYGIRYTEFFKPLEPLAINLENVEESSIASHTCYSERESSLNAQVEFILPDSDGMPVYAYFPSEYPREVNLWLDTNWVDTFFGNESTRVQSLGVLHGASSLIMTVVNSEVYLRENEPYFYYLDEELFTNVILDLQQYKAEVSEYTSTSLKASITVEDDMICYTSIPYQKGWSIYVDGEKVEYYEIMSALIGFDLSEGTHEIEMKYTPYGFTLGVGLGVVGVVLLLVLMYQEDPKRFMEFKNKIIRKNI
ncbi:MAG: YfhO family protein [Erysipelotrichales bacterium]|nr:YfhO family protein [Erysipelotrichales bacterium]